MAYSFDLSDLHKRCASDVGQIFKGATPADIPFYQPSKFELSVNLATASRLGISVPASLAASADWIVEQKQNGIGNRSVRPRLSDGVDCAVLAGKGTPAGKS